MAFDYSYDFTLKQRKNENDESIIDIDLENDYFHGIIIVDRNKFHGIYPIKNEVRDK